MILEMNGECSSPMETVEKSDANLDLMKESILNCVAESDGFFKSQQVGEKDLTFSEKRDIASEVLNRSVPLFLERYWKYIRIEDIEFFNSSVDYEIQFYVGEIRKKQNARTNKARIRNRRYEALKKMVDEGSYFSDSEMKRRNPFLYEQLVGQYLTESERIAEYNRIHKDDRFSHFLMGQFERNVENCLFDEQKAEDDAVVVSEEDNDLSEDESEIEEDDEPQKPSVTKQEQTLLKQEFTNIMYENFLAGKDQEFDYSSVDNNVEYDSVHQRNLDEEEKYFDED